MQSSANSKCVNRKKSIRSKITGASKRVSKKVIAISGGVCSGKSVVMQFLKEQGFTTINCDILARTVADYADVKAKIKEVFGIEFFDGDTLNRRKLANHVFESEINTQKLNQIMHGKILQLLKQEIDKANSEKESKKEVNIKANAFDKVFVEIALINGKGFANLFDEIWIVSAPKETRLSRLQLREGISLQQAQNLIHRQPDYDKLIFDKPNKIISNTSTLDNLFSQVRQLLNNL